MEIGAILVLSSEGEKQTTSFGPSARSKRQQPLADITAHILGRSLVDRAAAKLRDAGISQPSLVQESPASSQLSSPLSEPVFAWQQAMTGLAQHGAKHVVICGLSAYSDLDYRELLRFHVERKSSITQVYTADGPLDTAVVDTALFRSGATPALMLEHPPLQQERFYYRGYANRLKKAEDFMQLIEDSLYQRCGLQPAGNQVAEQIWVGQGAEVDDSCEIAGPLFIGAGTRVGACCMIRAGSSIENGCHIDCGTSIERSWILSGTYIGVGLNVRRSIVRNRKLLHLDYGTEITIRDRRLIGAKRSLPLLGMREGLREHFEAIPGD